MESVIYAIVFFVLWLSGMGYFLIWRATKPEKLILNRLIARTRLGAMDWIIDKNFNQEEYKAFDSELGLEYHFVNWGSMSGVIYNNRSLHIWEQKKEGEYTRNHLTCIGIRPAHLLKQLEDEIIIHLGMAAKSKKETEKENISHLADIMKIRETV